VGKKEKINQLLTLSEPELEVLKYFCTGEPNKKISKELFMAEGTVRGHMLEIYIKLGLFGYPTVCRQTLWDIDPYSK
jgi:ATP/maltotriose-dependent transcriptional regulator MalT